MTRAKERSERDQIGPGLPRRLWVSKLKPFKEARKCRTIEVDQPRVVGS